MKLITYNSSNTKVVRRANPVIRVSLKSGIVAISKTASEAMGLREGLSIAFHQDEDRKKDWYASIDETGFTVRKQKDSGGFQFNNCAFARKIAAELD